MKRPSIGNKTPLEKEVDKQIRKYAIRRGWVCFKFVSPMNRGVPDRIFLRDGKILFVEMKRKRKKPTALQLKMHEIIRGVKFPVYVLDDSEAFTLSLFD